MTDAPAARLERFCLKLFVDEPGKLDLGQAIPIFHRWIQAGSVDGLLIDVADYRHVPDGPGVILIGHEADYFLDEMEGPPGLLYNRKKIDEGSEIYRLRSAMKHLLGACRQLEREEEFTARFDGTRLRFIINDRLVSSNGVASIREAFDTLLTDLYPGQTPIVTAGTADPRDRYTLDVTTLEPTDMATLISRLEARTLKN